MQELPRIPGGRRHSRKDPLAGRAVDPGAEVRHAHGYRRAGRFHSNRETDATSSGWRMTARFRRTPFYSRTERNTDGSPSTTSRSPKGSASLLCSRTARGAALRRRAGRRRQGYVTPPDRRQSRSARGSTQSFLRSIAASIYARRGSRGVAAVARTRGLRRLGARLRSVVATLRGTYQRLEAVALKTGGALRSRSGLFLSAQPCTGWLEQRGRAPGR